MKRLAIIILNYRTPDMVIGCLETLEHEIDAHQDICIIVDNCSGDDSAERIEAALEKCGWGAWARLVRSDRNDGFSAGNNIGIQAVDVHHYMLLNSDTLVREGAVRALLDAAESNPQCGLVSPRLEWPDREPQVSCFRNRTPWSEFLRAASTGPLSRLFPRHEVALPVSDEPIHPEWTSFACALIRREVFEQIGLMDESYFMYFDDIDFCRRARRAGWDILHWPEAHVVHLRGGSGDVKSQTAERGRLPRYYYESRAWYFRKFYTRTGLWLTNLLWVLGRMISWTRERFGRKDSRICAHEWRDNWTKPPHRQPMTPTLEHTHVSNA